MFIEAHKISKRNKDKSDRATQDTVLDKKTVNILQSLVKRGMLDQMQGCISTGKEANVYMARASPSLVSKLIGSLEKKKEQRLIKQNKKIDSAKENVNEDVSNNNCEEIKTKDIIEIGKVKKLINFYQNDISNKITESKPEPDIIAEVPIGKYFSSIDKKEIVIDLVPCAIKIYQTSIMLFKDRLKYIISEKRFKTFCSTNPRKLVKLWAEKEVRNLKRLNKCNIPAPMPLYLKKNVLIMTLIQDQETNCDNKNKFFKPSPRLKDFVCPSFNILEDLYNQSISILFEIYNKCNLIHSDFSEYNLLVVQENKIESSNENKDCYNSNANIDENKKFKIYVIDMGQAVETDHVNADEFLLMDIKNINNFFKKNGVGVLSINQIFSEITKKNVPICLQNLEMGGGVTIPNRLSEVYNDEDRTGFLKETNESDESTEEDESDDNEILKNVGENMHTKEELKKIVKENRKIVKEMKREKRKVKVPKKEKKRREKLNKQRK